MSDFRRDWIIGRTDILAGKQVGLSRKNVWNAKFAVEYPSTGRIRRRNKSRMSIRFNGVQFEITLWFNNVGVLLAEGRQRSRAD